MNVEATLGRMNTVETKQMLSECISALPEAEMYDVLLDTLTKDQIEELSDAARRR